MEVPVSSFSLPMHAFYLVLFVLLPSPLYFFLDLSLFIPISLPLYLQLLLQFVSFFVSHSCIFMVWSNNRFHNFSLCCTVHNFVLYILLQEYARTAAVSVLSCSTWWVCTASQSHNCYLWAQGTVRALQRVRRRTSLIIRSSSCLPRYWVSLSLPVLSSALYLKGNSLPWHQSWQIEHLLADLRFNYLISSRSRVMGRASLYFTYRGQAF